MELLLEGAAGESVTLVRACEDGWYDMERAREAPREGETVIEGVENTDG